MKTYIAYINGNWYAFGANGYCDVVSIGSDNPPVETGCYVYTARWSGRGVLYVAKPCNTRNAAYQKARRYGEYRGEIKF